MSQFDDADIFTDANLVQDPHPYFNHLREKGPAVCLHARNVVAVTGHAAGVAIFRDDDRFSSVNAATGPIPPLPFVPEGDDITEQIAQHRDEIPYAGLIATQDAPEHTKTKALLMGMITPHRLKENHEFMVKLADQLIEGLVGQGSCEILSQYAQPFATLVIADLLGVPQEEHKDFRLLKGSTPGQISGENSNENNPLAWIGAQFFGYVEDRRQNPRDDVLTRLAQQKYSDGTLPSTIDVAKVAVFLFAAGQDTTVKLVAAMLRHLGDDLELQRKLRQERHLIPRFVEEVLRLDGTVKSSFRLAKKPAKVGDMDIAPGTTMMMLIGAMNRDPAKFENPNELQLDRKNSIEHLAFGKGIHSCAGAPLARAEAKVTLERLFDHTSEIRISEAKHGKPDARRYEFEPTYILRGMTELHVELIPK